MNENKRTKLRLEVPIRGFAVRLNDHYKETKKLLEGVTHDNKTVLKVAVEKTLREFLSPIL